MSLDASLPTIVSDDPHERPIDVGAMPMWRKAQIAAGIIRGCIRFRANAARLPIIHGGVSMRQHNGSITIGHLAELHERVVVSAIGRVDDPARVAIGPKTSVWYNTVISARREVTIGSHCAISWNCSILDDDMHELLDLDKSSRGAMPVHIDDHVWIGAGATILKGVTIGRDSVIAAGSIVTRDVPPKALVAGAPARVIRAIAGWR